MSRIIMAVDFGDARTGLALSDESGLIAYGAGCINSKGLDKTAVMCAEEARKNGVSLILVGDPINMDDSIGPRCLRARKFAARVSQLCDIPHEMRDERLTTVQAHEILSENLVTRAKRKKSVDELSATLILQDYLDEQRAKIKQDDKAGKGCQQN